MSDLSIFILFLLVIAVMLGVDFVFYIVYVVAGIYLFSRWYTPRSAGKLRVSRRLNDHAFLGEQVPIEISVENSSRLPLPWLQLSESIPAQLQVGGKPRFAIALRGREKRTFRYEVVATRRGYYRLGPLQFINGDFFGFSEHTGYADAVYLTVYPRISALSPLRIRSRLPFGTIKSQQRLFEDPARPAGVRTYQAGDSLRLINWKVSAHANRGSGDLMVKTLEPAISLETAILLNLYRHDYWRRTAFEVAEWSIEVAASLAAHLSNARQSVGLMTNGSDPLFGRGDRVVESLLFDKDTGRLLRESNEGEDGPRDVTPAPVAPRAGRAQLMKILETLARVELSGRTPFVSWAPAVTSRLNWGVTLLAISPRCDEAVCSLLHGFLRSGYNPVLIVTEKRASFGTVRARARGLGFPAYQLAEPGDYRLLMDLQRPVAFVGSL